MSYKGMTREEASKVKTRGHDREDELAALIGGIRIPGQGKGDVLDLYRKIHSLKAPNKNQLQVCLHTKPRISEVFYQEPELVSHFKNLLVFPDYLLQYNEDPECYKNRLVAPVCAAVELLQNVELLLAFLKIAFFDGTNVDYLTLLPDLRVFHTFQRESVLDVLQTAVVEPSGGSDTFARGCQKVLFKYPIGGTLVRVGEIEVRHEQHHMNKFKFWMHKTKLFQVLSSQLNSYRVERDSSYQPPEDPQQRLPYADDPPRFRPPRGVFGYKTAFVGGQEVKIALCSPGKAKGANSW